jgi:ribosomal protein L37AE/L43A
MSLPEDIPEDQQESYPCECGGSITLNKKMGQWECDTCEEAKP